jgi:ATP-dependent DNA helicase RecG
VGRGPTPSRCYLVVSRDADPAIFDRLEILIKNAKGADIARADLAMRGPGDLLGARQSGPSPLRFIRFARDYRLIEQAREMASAWLAEDPALEKPQSEPTRVAIERMVERGLSFANVA